MRASFLLPLALVACSHRETPNAHGVDAGNVTTAAPIDAGGEAKVVNAAPPGPFNVLLISIDSLRADMPWAGYDRPIAPNLTKFAERAVRFTAAYSTSSFTSKSIPGLLTGRYPSELTRTGSFFTKYLDPDQFVCTHLKKEAIPCIGGHAHMYFAPGTSGFENGFSAWKIVPGITFDYQTDPWITSDKLAPMAIEMLRTVSSEKQPFVAWFHFMDPHDEYKSHVESPHFGKKARDLYDEEVFFTDLWVGKLLDFVAAQPWAGQTAILLTADHGEAFGEHGATRHAHEVWEPLVHVPLLLAVPGVAPRAIDHPRAAIDIMPTIVDLVGAKNVPALRGTSLVPEARTGKGEPRDVIVDLPEDDYNERRRALVHEEGEHRYKIIAFGEDRRFSLFDLASDPQEDADLFAKDKDLATAMRARYRDASKSIVESPPRGGIPKKTQ